jgi:hypothetical protein
LDQARFLALSTDREYSIRVGIELAQIYRRYIRKHYPAVPDRSELLWRLTKARHGASGLLNRAMAELAKAHQEVTWDAVVTRMSQTKLGPKIVANVEHLFKYATLFKPLVAMISAGVGGATGSSKANELESEARSFRFSGSGSRFGDRGFDRRRVGSLSSGGFAASSGSPVDSDSIRTIQSQLADTLGMPVPVTGFVGPATRRALRIYQSRSGLPVTGSLDPRTLAALGISPGGGPFDDSAPPMGTSWIPRFRSPMSPRFPPMQTPRSAFRRR